MDEYLSASTLLLVIAVEDIVLCAMLLYVDLRRKTYRGFRDFAYCTIAGFAGFGLLTSTGKVPALLSAVGGYGFAVLSIGFIARGLDRFAGIEKGNLRYFLPTGLVAASTAVFIAFSPLMNPITFIATFAAALEYAYCVRRSAVDLKQRLGITNGVVIFFTVANSAWFLIRAFAAVFLTGQVYDILHSTFVTRFSFLITLVNNIGLMTGLIVLNGQRIELELKTAMDEVRTLQGIIPICSSCKKIRDDKGYWQQVEHYVRQHSQAEFTHSICPDCLRKLYPDAYREIYEEGKGLDDVPSRKTDRG